MGATVIDQILDVNFRLLDTKMKKSLFVQHQASGFQDLSALTEAFVFTMLSRFTPVRRSKDQHA